MFVQGGRESWEPSIIIMITEMNQRTTCTLSTVFNSMIWDTHKHLTVNVKQVLKAETRIPVVPPIRVCSIHQHVALSYWFALNHAFPNMAIEICSFPNKVINQQYEFCLIIRDRRQCISPRDTVRYNLFIPYHYTRYTCSNYANF